MIAALYVQKGGVYFGLDGVDPWDEERDARLYGGPSPVVAHPPCARWCRLAKLVESLGGKAVGDDEGTFAAALASVRAWGGVLEHPAWSMAWAVHGLTWLYYVGAAPPPALDWSRPRCEMTTTTNRRTNGRRVEMQDKAERSRTPIPFRDLLLAIAARAHAA